METETTESDESSLQLLPARVVSKPSKKRERGNVETEQMTEKLQSSSKKRGRTESLGDVPAKKAHKRWTEERHSHLMELVMTLRKGANKERPDWKQIALNMSAKEWTSSEGETHTLEFTVASCKQQYYRHRKTEGGTNSLTSASTTITPRETTHTNTVDKDVEEEEEEKKKREEEDEKDGAEQKEEKEGEEDKEEEEQEKEQF